MVAYDVQAGDGETTSIISDVEPTFLGFNGWLDPESGLYATGCGQRAGYYLTTALGLWWVEELRAGGQADNPRHLIDLWSVISASEHHL